MKFYLFTAPWCGPCTSFKPVVREVVDANDSLEVEEIDVSDQSNGDLVSKMKIRAVPTLVAYDEDMGRINKAVAGVMNHQQLLDFFSEV